MNAPGVRAKKTGTRLARGRALQVMVYPRAEAKRRLVQASRDAGLALSSFMVLSGLKEAAALQGRKIEDLIAADELQQYRRSRVYRKSRAKGE